MSGRVLLVGAGPGDPGLMTLRAMEAIAAADVILHDRLIPPQALTHAREDAVIIDVGKTGGGEQVPQAETERLMLEHARAGRTVVRLKGGDPFVFGRGGEEALLCRELDIPFEVVPGVTAGIAAPAFAGIPVTQRGMSSSVALVTGRSDGEALADLEALARFPGTLVVYMGVAALERLAEDLIGAGRDPDEPSAIIERGTLPTQFTVAAPLSEIAARASAARVSAPAVLVVGRVATLHDRLDWISDGPLGRVAVVVTRTPRQASPLSEKLRELGARVIEAPAIAIRPLGSQLLALDPFDLLVLTSVNGVECFFHSLRASGRDARDLAGKRVGVVGPGTADALRRHGIEPDVIPDRAIGDALAAALAPLGVRNALIGRAKEGRDVVADALREQGAEVTTLPLYETLAVKFGAELRDAVLAADWAIFASASAARHFVAAVGGPEIVRIAELRLATIGPQTTAALRELGLEPTTEAVEHTPDGLVAALVQKASG